MTTQYKRSTRRTGLAKTSQNRKTAHAKNPSSSAISEAGGPQLGDRTAVHVTVRCRSRSERETKEDHPVILRTDGIKGKTVEVSIGPSINKTYSFDRVFSSAADQRTVYEDTVLPMVDELLLGYNCTIFAYGQTGTGKTYTMFGNMTEEFGLLSDNAGIVPRTLYTLFDKLKRRDSTVKCSFIELYNETIRDLLADKDDTKLQLFENERNGATGSLLVKGMQESYIDSPSAGLRLLEMGSRKRHVAATKCNDLSSRSHTIFTINVLTKTSDESITSGKLNLRSGAENRRAVEAGQINKSLLTLGRVINALVDKSSHVPYSHEETVSTLDYAFRAKNIHNRPRINNPVPKDTKLLELAQEIENLKRNLRATRDRNGVYMTSDTHEEMMKEIESRRIMNEEQNQSIEALESGLRHKSKELLAVTRELREANLELNQMNDALNKAQNIWGGSVAEISDITEKMAAAQENQTLLYDSFRSVDVVGEESRTQVLRDKTEEAFRGHKQISKTGRVTVSEAMNGLSQAIARISEGLEEELSKCNNQKTLLDVARLLEEERLNAEVERNKFLAEIGALYDRSCRQRWDRLQGNHSIISGDISSSEDLIQGLTIHTRIDECINKQKQLAKELVDARNNLKVRMGQDKESLAAHYSFARQAAVSARKDLQQGVDNHEENLHGQLELWARDLEKTQSQNNQLVFDNSMQFQKDMALQSDTIEQPINALEKEICEPLLQLRTNIQSCSLPTSATLQQDSTASVNRGSLIFLVHKEPKEQDSHDIPISTYISQKDNSHEEPDSLAKQPSLEVIPDDSEQPRLKRRRL
ncbi:P-loop containing nucleoside triphosphate hydrolase protein [Aspergillus karnatakaensis]|uniref:P-loop containing nucleoside triphosphate hydrolase protein n=1 Tax=Aspergillus karnatakaensis TaxID=1810916 RepID=UPI003CCDE271